MIEFLSRLKEGIELSELDNQFDKLIDILKKAKALKEESGYIRLDSKFRVGKISISKKGTGYLDALDEGKSRDLLIEDFNLNGANQDDIVLVKRLFSKKGAQAKVIEILKRAYRYSVVYIDSVDSQIVAKNIKTDLVMTLAISQKGLKEYKLGSVLKVDNETLGIIELLGDINDPKVDEKISLALFNKVEFFSEDAEEEASKKGDRVDISEYDKRVDLRELPFCTIDPVDAKDFDDAIYFDIDRYELYVAIADVSEYVVEDTQLDKEAKARGFSIYFPHKSIPMLPRTLSEGICSLKPNVDRLAFVVSLSIDKDSLKVKSSRFFEAVIHSKRRFTYEEVDRFLEGDFSNKKDEDDEILEYLLPLQKLLLKIKKQRLSKGCEFRSSEIKMILDREQNLIKTTKEYETPSHSLIEDAMLLANKAAAKEFERGIFRTHDYPDPNKLSNLISEIGKFGVDIEEKDDVYQTIKDIQKASEILNLREEIDMMLIRSQKQALYTYEALNGHFGLGFSHYTHFTSPIRRYSDLIVHRIIKAKLKGKKESLEYINKNAKVISMRVSELEREAAMVEWDFKDRKFARWFDKHKGIDIEAIVIEVNSSVPIAITTSPIEGARVFINSEDELNIFDKVILNVTNSYITNTKIIASLKSINKI